MRRWFAALLVGLAGCSAPVKDESARPVPQAPLTTLSNGSIGLKVGPDGFPSPTMWLAARSTGTGPDPAQAVPCPLRFRLVDTEDPSVRWTATVAASSPAENRVTVRCKGRRSTVVLEYSLHPDRPALAVRVWMDGPYKPTVLHSEAVAGSPLVARFTGDAASLSPGGEIELGGAAKTLVVSLPGTDAPPWPSVPAPPTVKIIGDEDAARALDGMIGRLVSGYRSGNCWGPFSLTDGKFQGRVFWDLDAWVQPAMVFLDPETAKDAATWRLSTLPQAKRNYDAWVAQGRPVSDKKKLADVGPVGTAPPGGAMFAWESSMSGEELSTAPTRFEHHVTGSVCLGLRYAWLAGLVPTADLRAAERAAFRFYEARSTPRGPAPADIRSVVSPDEWHVVDNDLYTNSLADRLARHVPKDDPIRFGLPRDEVTYMAYRGDEMKGYQQASALLAVWPLGSVSDRTEVGKMYDRFAGKEARQGPAMTKSLNALVAARIGRADEALRQWRDSWRLYTDDPGLRFREKQKDGEGYFYTGAAGCVNAFLYGFLGLDLTESEPQGVPWKERTTSGWVSLNPHLPGAWKQVDMKGLWINGRRRHVTVTSSKLEVTDPN
ncbi:MAG: hypothetical protein KF857_00790 [Fimbriimonadaceae bacterium]|nr:hypothetical protein [Fimbriimonadaceae bacterium]